MPSQIAGGRRLPCDLPRLKLLPPNLPMNMTASSSRHRPPDRDTAINDQRAELLAASGPYIGSAARQ